MKDDADLAGIFRLALKTSSSYNSQSYYHKNQKNLPYLMATSFCDFWELAGITFITKL
jgi:hypothetical protein